MESRNHPPGKHPDGIQFMIEYTHHSDKTPVDSQCCATARSAMALLSNYLRAFPTCRAEHGSRNRQKVYFQYFYYPETTDCAPVCDATASSSWDIHTRYSRHKICHNVFFATNLMTECRKPFIDMTYQTNTGSCSNRIYRDEPGFGVGSHKITASSSMPCSGFFARARHGGICPLPTGGGKTPTGASAAGAIRAFGSRCWKSSLSSRITNGS